MKYTAYFFLNAALIYKGGIFLEKNGKIKKNLLKIILFWLVGNLCFFKYNQKFIDMVLFLNPDCAILPNVKFPVIIFPLGLSYIIFRLVHYIIEIYRGSIPRGNFVDFLLYIFFFPTFLAGPVDRFERFHPQAVSEKSINLTDLNSALYRIGCGLIKKFIIADSITRFIMPILYSPQDYSRLVLVCVLYGLALRIYMDFAGYTDIALGVSKSFGYKIMENFDRPFLKSNIALFWRSWHISVYSWIRDYFFFPLFGYRASNIKIYIGILLTMVVFMLWHNGNMNFLILGIYHGIGLMAWQAFQEIKRRYPLIRQLTHYRYSNIFSIFLTFNFVSFGFVFLSQTLPNALFIIQRIVSR
jgi:alginate O-acetyltransferase complex protein AlgI